MESSSCLLCHQGRKMFTTYYFDATCLGLYFGVFVDGGILIGRIGLRFRNGIHGSLLFGSHLMLKVYSKAFSLLLGGLYGG